MYVGRGAKFHTHVLRSTSSPREPSSNIHLTDLYQPFSTSFQCTQVLFLSPGYISLLLAISLNLSCSINNCDLGPAGQSTVIFDFLYPIETSRCSLAPLLCFNVSSSHQHDLHTNLYFCDCPVGNCWNKHVYPHTLTHCLQRTNTIWQRQYKQVSQEGKGNNSLRFHNLQGHLSHNGVSTVHNYAKRCQFLSIIPFSQIVPP